MGSLRSEDKEAEKYIFRPVWIGVILFVWLMVEWNRMDLILFYLGW